MSMLVSTIGFGCMPPSTAYLSLPSTAGWKSPKWFSTSFHYGLEGIATWSWAISIHARIVIVRSRKFLQPVGNDLAHFFGVKHNSFPPPPARSCDPEYDK